MPIRSCCNIVQSHFLLLSKTWLLCTHNVHTANVILLKTKLKAKKRRKKKCPRCYPLKNMYIHREYHQICTLQLHSICLIVCLQMAAKMGGDQPNMNSSPPVIDPSLYGFGSQKRPLDNGGKPSVHTHNGCADCSDININSATLI